MLCPQIGAKKKKKRGKRLKVDFLCPGTKTLAETLSRNRSGQCIRKYTLPNEAAGQQSSNALPETRAGRTQAGSVRRQHREGLLHSPSVTEFYISFRLLGSQNLKSPPTLVCSRKVVVQLCLTHTDFKK